MSIFKEFIISNKKYWYHQFRNKSENSYALIDASINETYLLYGILKVGLIFCKLHGLTPIAFPYITTSRKNRKIIDSMCIRKVNVECCLITVVFINFFKIIKTVFRIKTKSDTLNLVINGVAIGKYIYDQCYIPLVNRITFRMRLRILYALACYFLDEKMIKKGNIKFVVIGDPVARGFLFELCRIHKIKCINAINVNMFQMHKYYTSQEFDNHCRFVSQEILDKIPDNEKFIHAVEEYFKNRFNGIIAAHDVIRAYSNKKIIYSKERLYREYKLRPGFPLVVVMAHCFNDTPHAYPKMLYRDYEDWLINTVLALSRNQNINFLVKEHPSSDIYNEKGIVSNILNSLGCGTLLLKSDTHTQTIINSADYVVTCGGTIGIEISVFGKPVILAARPPYSKKGFTIEPENIDAYESILANTIQTIPMLSTRQILQAKKTSFVMFELYNNYNDSLELGSIKYILGEKYDVNEFYYNVILQNNIRLEEQQIYKIFSQFNSSDDVSIINYKKLYSLI